MILRADASVRHARHAPIQQNSIKRNHGSRVRLCPTTGPDVDFDLAAVQLHAVEHGDRVVGFLSTCKLHHALALREEATFAPALALLIALHENLRVPYGASLRHEILQLLPLRLEGKVPNVDLARVIHLRPLRRPLAIRRLPSNLAFSGRLAVARHWRLLEKEGFYKKK